MRIKGLFGQTQKNEKNTIDHDIDKQIKRINTLEVQIGRLINLEKNYRKQKMEEETKKKSYVSGGDPQNQQKYVHLQNMLVNMEQMIQRLQEEITSRDSQYKTSLKLLEDRLNESLLEIDERKAYFEPSESKLNLESIKSSLTNSITTSLTEIINEYINQKFLFIESNISLINEIQVDINKRLNNLESNISEYIKMESQDKKETTILKEITIEKFYLDKYEQNNNIAQLGIKELSGALNIGATYGTGVIPEELTEQMKSEMEELHSAKKDYEENKNTNIHDESSNENSGNPEVNNDFTDVNIED